MTKNSNELLDQLVQLNRPSPSVWGRKNWNWVDELFSLATNSWVEVFTPDSPVSIEIPGTRREDIKVEVEPLDIEGQYGPITQDDVGLVIVSTPRYGAVNRIGVRPGFGKDPQKYLSTEYENGVLTLFLDHVSPEEKEKWEKKGKKTVTIPV